MHLLKRTIFDNPYVPKTRTVRGETVRYMPHPKQAEFLCDMSSEVMFGGAAGGGKSESLLLAALQFVQEPNYSAIVFRRTYADLALPGAIMDRAAEWLSGTDAKWRGETKTWQFPNGSTLSFGYLDTRNDRYRYQGSEFQFVGFDELTQFKEDDYLYLFSRLRRNHGSPLFLRMRSATNPGGEGHAWVKRRFIKEGSAEQGRIFISSKLVDNPSNDQESYRESLSKLSSFTRRQLEYGDWTDPGGNHFFPHQWPEYVNLGDSFAIGPFGVRQVFLRSQTTIVIAVDWATRKKNTSDYTAMVVGGIIPDGRILILDVVNERLSKEVSPLRLAALCAKWGPNAIVVTEDDPYSQMMQSECRRFSGIPEMKMLPIESQAKVVRCTPAMIHAENKRILRPDTDPPWWDDYSDQLSAFTGIQAEHDDMVDATGMIARMADKLKPSRKLVSQPVILTGTRGM